MTSDIYSELSDKGFCIIKNLLTLEEYNKVRNEAINYFNNIVKIKKNIPKALRGNIGAGMHDIVGYSDNNKWKLYRGCYFPWNKINKNLKNTISLSRKLSNYRNNLIGIDKNRGSIIEDDGYIQYTSLSFYPSDGGFIYRHSDGHPKDDEHKLIHFKVELTIKNEDYEKGGLYIWDNQNNRIDVSSLIKPGDIIFFNGENYHEIKPVEGKYGRIALFEIPTYVEQFSRIYNYSTEGESIISKIKRSTQNKLKNFIKKI